MFFNPKSINFTGKKITILGLGESGGKFVHSIEKQYGDKYNLLYADWDERGILESTVKAIRVDDYMGDDIYNLINEIKDSKKLLVVTGLGGGFGTIAIPIIIYIAEELNLDIELHLSYPAKIEGKQRRANANLVTGLINRFDIDSVIYNFDKLLETLDGQGTMNDCFRIMNEIICDDLENRYLSKV